MSIIRTEKHQFDYSSNVVSQEDSEIVLSVRNLSKKFCKSLKRGMLYGMLDLTKNMLGIKSDNSYLRKTEFWALDNISFDLRNGEGLGLLGANGSGKSTLLRVINGIFPPDNGIVKIRGRVGGLISIGVGFHPHMTGRENIYLNGTILGMTKKEIDYKFKSIVEFSEIGDFLDTPVNAYSSGMRVRLGFAIAINSEPDVLLIDEVLAVGDVSFRNKCLRKLHTIRESGKAIIFVSHTLRYMKDLSQKILLLDKGKTVFYGDKDEALSKYHAIIRETTLRSLNVKIDNHDSDRSYATQAIEIVDHGLLNNQDHVVRKITEKEDIVLYFDLNVHKDIVNSSIYISILDLKGDYLITYNTGDDRHFKKGYKYRLKIRYFSPKLKAGVYKPLLYLSNTRTAEEYLRDFNLNYFVIDGDVKRNDEGLISCQSDLEIMNEGSL